MAYKEVREYSDINKVLDIIFPAHFHSDIEIVYVIEGVLLVGIGNQMYELHAGEIAVIPSNSIHFFDQKENAGTNTDYILVFSPEMLYENLFVTPFVVTPNDSQMYLEKFQQLSTVFQEKGRSYILEMQSMITDICYHLSCEEAFVTSHNAVRNVYSDSKIQHVLEYINNNLKEELSFEEICERFSISEARLRKEFMDTVGMTFAKYVANRRICMVESMLRQTDVSIIDICYECGFSSVRTFNRIFLKATGLTPMQYRKKYLEQPEHD